MTLIPIQSQTGLVSGSVMVAISCLLALGLLHCGDSEFIRVSGFREDLALIDRCWLLWLHPLLVQSFVTFCQIGTCIMNAFMGTLTRKFNNDSPWTTISQLLSPHMVAVVYILNLHWGIQLHATAQGKNCQELVFIWATSQYKDRLICVWRFPC